MRPELTVTLFFIGAALSCTASTESPISQVVDASSADGPLWPDADPSCQAWRLKNANVVSVTLLETTPVQGRSARLRVTLEQCPGDLLGASENVYDLESKHLTISGSVWRTQAARG